jgi:carboxyl-terminal processing protease
MRGQPDEIDRTDGSVADRSTPMIVLTDGASASATEIVAGALQDHDRALVVGTRTFGKGVVQQVFRLDGEWAFKLTTGKWYTPSGRSIHRARVIGADGRLTEVADTLAGEAAAYRSQSGRALRGGGGIFPDIIVEADTVPTGERDFLRAVAPEGGAVVSVLNEEAVRLRADVRPDFVVSPEWVSATLAKLSAAGVRYDPALNDAARTVIRRELDERVARLAFGDSGVARRTMHNDRQLTHAMALLRGKTTQEAVFAGATAISRGAGSGARPR